MKRLSLALFGFLMAFIVASGDAFASDSDGVAACVGDSSACMLYEGHLIFGDFLL